MKTNLISAIAALLSIPLLSLSLSAQNAGPQADSTGYPGDGFSLEAAVELFKKAQSPEDFEKLLNSEDNAVNNLDLNEDGEIDYIRVIDNMDGDVHAVVLQVPVSETESQDIAVIEIEKTGQEEATLQIIGDEDVYGKQVIVEPFEEEKTSEGRNGPAVGNQPVRIVVNVWLWPSVRFVYRPGYVVWVSPWRWRLYPTWWRPWRPHPWGWYHVRVRPYYTRCHVVTVHRVTRAHAVYAPRRTHSTVVHTRTVTHGPRGGTKTKTTTTVRGKNGNVKAQRSTTTRSGPHGHVKQQKTTTKVRRGRN